MQRLPQFCSCHPSRAHSVEVVIAAVAQSVACVTSEFLDLMLSNRNNDVARKGGTISGLDVGDKRNNARNERVVPSRREKAAVLWSEFVGPAE